MANRTYNLARADIVEIYVNNNVKIKEVSSPPSQITDYGLIYVMDDGNLYYINESGSSFLLNSIDSAGDVFRLLERSSSPSPEANYGLIYVKDDNNIYFLNDNGDEFQLNAASYSTEDYFSIGGLPPGPYPTLRRCTIDSTGGIDITAGSDLMLNSDIDTSPDQQFIAEKIWTSVWNDLADFQKLAFGEISNPGKCYYDTKEGAKICNIRCQKSVIGICTDTFGLSVGTGIKNGIAIAISGWTLAYVDKEYESGTPLTNDENGNLTEMTIDEIHNNPERLVAIYKKKEENGIWGPQGKEILVNGRHWVKVK